MIINQDRYQETKDHTKSLVFIDGEFQCFFLEDGSNPVKVHGETRIPAGTYKITLREEGGMHSRYLKKFGEKFHKGMLWIRSIPNYEYVYIHIGNDPKDTLGCPLTGTSPDRTKPLVKQSTKAYKKIYPQIVDKLLKGREVRIVITDP